MVATSADAGFMERALFLAERGRGSTSPNPLVGAVVVSDAGIVVGQGAHLRVGEAHAEVIALTAAGPRAAGATLYCTLEPCCHTGRTGPCVERIVPAGISRVVAAMADPNPRVSGRGFDYLRARGIEVTVGVGEHEAGRLNAPFVTWITRSRPLVIAKVAVSADGFVSRSRERALLTGPAANRYFHRQRAEIDAIAVGAGTVLADDPLLTARLAYRARPLMRVVFDWSLRVSPAARLFSTLSEGPVIMAVGRQAADARRGEVDALERAGATVLPLAERSVGQVLNWLGDQNVTSLLVEGGSGLHQAFFDAGVVDRLQYVTTPVRLGDGVAAAPALVEASKGARPTRTIVLGDDLLVETDVHGIG